MIAFNKQQLLFGKL